MNQRLLKNGLIIGSIILAAIIGLQLREGKAYLDLRHDVRGQITLMSDLEEALWLNEDDSLVDSLLLEAELQLFPKLKEEDQGQIRLLYLKAVRFAQLQNINKAQLYLEQAESLITKADTQLEYDVIGELQSVYNKLGDTQRRDELLTKYILVECPTQLMTNRIELLLNKSQLASQEAKQNQAMLLTIEAKKIAESIVDTNMIVRCQSWAYYLDTTLSIEDRLLGLLELEAYEDQIEDDNLWRLYANIADIYYFDLADNEKTYEYMLKQVNIVGGLEKGFRKKRIQSVILLNMSDAALNIGKYDEAQHWIDSAEAFLAYMNASWLSSFHDTYVGAYQLNEQDALAKLALINEYVEYEHIAKSDSQVRLIEEQSKIALMMLEQQAKQKLFWSTMRTCILAMITLLLLWLTYMGYRASRRIRRRIKLDNGIKELQNLFIFGTIQARAPIHCHLKNVMLEVKINGFDDLADKVTTATNSLRYTAGNWEQPLESLHNEIKASKLLIAMWANDDYYSNRHIELYVEDSIPTEALLVPRYFVKACVFMILNAMVKGDAEKAQLILSYTHEELRMAVTLDNKKDIMIEFDKATEAINRVLGLYNMEEVTFEPASDKYVVNVVIPYEEKKT